MARVFLGLASIAVALLLMTATGAIGADDAGTVDGTIHTVTEEQITVTVAEAKMETFTVSQECDVTLDGEEADITDLKAGMKAALTVGPAKTATKIAAESAAAE